MTTDEARQLQPGDRVTLHEFAGVVTENDGRVAVLWDDGGEGVFWTHQGADETDHREDPDGLRFLELETPNGHPQP